MSSIRSHLLSTTALSPRILAIPKPKKNISVRVSKPTRSAKDPGGTIKPAPKAASREGTIGIMKRTSLRVPKLTTPMLKALDEKLTPKITRHFNHQHLAGTIAGSFRFGTIAGYRPADTAQAGRLGDIQEGSQREVFSSRSGLYDVDLPGMEISGNQLIGFDSPIVLEYIVNDFCSCASIGPFQTDRAFILRSKGNAELDTFVVYDLEKLTMALDEVFSEDTNLQHLKTISRNVVYGQKDRHWDIEGNVSVRDERDSLAVWLGTTFVKPEAYKHEEELRILAVCPDRPGQLPNDAEPMMLNDPRIADAITEYGHF